MKKAAILICLILAGLLAACGSKDNDSRNDSIDGTYVYEDAVCRSTVTISGDTWRMKTQFGAPGYYTSDAKYDSGTVKGNELYYSHLFVYGKVSGRRLSIASRNYIKQ